jgi:hypothetical protein
MRKHALFGATLWRHVNNSLNVCTALITELKIFVFGAIQSERSTNEPRPQIMI